MVKIFRICGYTIGNERGRKNVKSNLADAGLSFTYLCLSLMNSLGSNPSDVVFFINAITLGRLVIKNFIEQSQVASKAKEDSSDLEVSGFTTIHLIKIVIEVTAIMFLVIFYCWNKVNQVNMSYVLLTVVLVLVMTFLENVMCVLERLYDAHPRALMWKVQ
jgi:hypothetical protein